ncbi:NmrA/HSCARG family protein [Nocardia sp. NBC_00403]|uniref:NmrA/HSCARG family protein n=1 Tax=Nocardia sp. NBC_00403 TaxID=2975990 RepID=UPI002E244AFC
MPAEHPILVTGATGWQGGAAARHLLANGWRVRVLVRTPCSRAAQALAEAGAELAPGDMDSRTSLDAAMRDAYGVFSVQPTQGYPGTPTEFTIDDEIRLGVNVADAAKAAGVQHFIYASVGGADRKTGIRRWESKRQVERHIDNLGLPATILRPVRFMENQADPQLGVRDSTLADVFLPEVPVQLIAVSDIGAFAALAFGSPHEYLGKAIELAGDELTMPQIVDAITNVTGHPVTYRHIPREALQGRDPDAIAGYIVANEKGGWQADIPALRKLHPTLMTFDTWLTKEGKAKFDTLLGNQP